MDEDTKEIERVARLICVACGDNPDWLVAQHALPVSFRGRPVLSGASPAPGWCSYIDAARVVIADRVGSGARRDSDGVRRASGRRAETFRKSRH